MIRRSNQTSTAVMSVWLVRRGLPNRCGFSAEALGLSSSLHVDEQLDAAYHD
jgi:hypothetical protein